MTSLISHAAHILPVKDIQSSALFYTDKLGFTVELKWGNPIDYLIVSSGDVSIHINKKMDQSYASTVHTRIYFFVSDIDLLYTNLIDKGVTIKTPIGTRDYGMRDFDIVDPDGYILSFGMGTTS